MLDVLDAKELLPNAGYTGVRGKAIISFLAYLEKKLRARIVYDGSTIPFQRPDLLDLSILAERLRKCGAILQYFPSSGMPDEPRLHQWQAVFMRDPEASDTEAASGTSVHSDRVAFTLALAEAVERHVWATREDYAKTRQGTVRDMRHKTLVLPETFVGLSPKERESNPLRSEQSYLWVKGRSLITQKTLWLPFQTVTGKVQPNEPFIREQNSAGSAVHESRDRALLAGALELLERDAFMITWLNQLTPPKLDLKALSLRNANLSEMLVRCARYRLHSTALRLFTDAPAYVVGVILEDETGQMPLRTLGLKAHRDPAAAAEGALREALSSRLSYRMNIGHVTTPLPGKQDLKHFDRLRYWAQDGNHSKLAFLTAGIQQHFIEPWETDSETAHLTRIVQWCRESGYECASVSLTRSLGNPTPWHIERVVIPQLQPMYVRERLPHTSGPRMSDIPKRFGFTPRSEPYLTEPHPLS